MKRVKYVFIIMAALLFFVVCNNKNPIKPSRNNPYDSQSDLEDAVNIVSPKDGQEVSSDAMIFKWTKNDSAETYSLWVSKEDSTVRDTSKAEMKILKAEDVETTGDNKVKYQWINFPVKLCKSGDILYWRIRMSVPEGKWSDVAEFVIILQGPSAPVLSLPSNGFITSDNTPLFDWSDITDAANYELQVDNIDSFDSPDIDENNLTSSTYTASSSLADGKYYWHVRAKDSAGNWGGWSGTWSFTIDTKAPAAPTLSSPSDGSTTNNETPTFEWSDINDAANYELQVDDKENFLSRPDMVIADSNSTSSTYTASDITDGTYYWRVRAKDSAGNWSRWSDIWSFTVDTQGPQAPTLLKPDNESTIPDSTPEFRWDKVEGADKYELEVDNSSSFTGPEIHKTSLEDSSYTASEILPDGTYYWHVRAKDSAGNWSRWSDIWSFTVDTNE